MATGETGLGNQAILAKIDKLRELNIGATIPLPQLVVVGDQSSGKSSVLESLTGFSFPRAPGLCTRYATQITCCREQETSIRVSIIPRPGADEMLKAKLLEFKRCLSSIDGDDFVQVFKDANVAMGIRMDAAQKDVGRAAFSEDILKIEISGPDVGSSQLPGPFFSADLFIGRRPDLKLITKIMKLNEVFSNVFWKRGHKQHFGPTWDDEGEDSFGRTIDQLPFEIHLARYSELEGIIRTDDYQCPKPLKGPIMSHIEEVFESSRGPELGTFGGTILATVFEEQSEKWEHLVLSHVSNAIALVHHYIFQLLTELCPEKQVRDNLWDTILLDRLVNSYQQAMCHSRFLLDIERGGTPNTFNHYFNANLQKKRCERMTKTFSAMAVASPWKDENERYVPMSKIGQHAVNKDNGQQVCEDILDTLMSYYKVSRKRFVDVVCQQVIFHLLLEGGGSPLKVFDPELIMNLDHDKLEQIAGEDAESKHQRQAFKREVASFEEALKVLRS